MSGHSYLCRECGRFFSGSSMAWETIDLLACPHCGGVEIEIDLSDHSTFESWARAEEQRRDKAA